jgi:hypothetical protein
MILEVDLDRPKVNLTKDELYFLRLFAHNYSYEQIEDFFCIDTKERMVLEKSLKQKLNAFTSFETIVKGFELKILNEYDFADSINKRLCLTKTNTWYNEYINNNLDAPKLINELLDLLRIYDCELDKANMDVDLKIFSEPEISYITLRLLKESYISCVNFNDNEFNGLVLNTRFEDSINVAFSNVILSKLKVNSWYNAYVRAVELKLIEKPDYIQERIKRKVKICKNNILHILRLKRMSEKDKIHGMYRELVLLLINYNKIY